MNERTIFMEALEKETPAQRSDYLDVACGGDPALRQRVAALLRSHEQAGNFLGKPPAERLAEQLANPEALGARPEDTVADDKDSQALGFLAPPDRPDMLGRLGHYEVLEVIGRGGMGIVLRAFDEKLHRVVAIKVMATQLAINATARKRFVREAQAAAAIRNQHVIDIHAVEDANALPYLAMEYVAGVSLQERLDRSGPLELKEILRIGMQTAAGLAAAHAQGLIHRDVKPANILLENGVERVRLTDFGLARAVDDASLTQSGVVAGTPQYMSPEQARGEVVDQRTDLFSLGSVLYAMCTGRAPFRASGSMAVLKRVCEETPSPIRETNPEIPEWLVAIIDRLHAKDPAERFQSAAEVAELLGRHLAHVQHPSVAPLPAALPLLSPERRGAESEGDGRGRRRRWAMAAVVLLLCAAGGLGLTEAAGVTNLRATVVRIFTPDGTLVVEVDDPGVKVTIEGDGGLVITGAGPQEVRLRPGSYRVQADKDGKRVPLERELVSIAKGGREVVRVKLEAAPGPAAAKAEKGAFVLLAAGKERKFDTLAEAVQTASDGETIEIRGNGPFATEPLNFDRRALVIRAGKDFQPALTLNEKGAQSRATMIATQAALVLEGLEFLIPSPTPPPTDTGAGTFLTAGQAPLHIANCRFSAKVHDYSDCISSNASITVVRNCEFLRPASVPIHLFSRSRTRCLIDNCVHGGVYILAIHDYGHTEDAELRLTHNTFISPLCPLIHFAHVATPTKPLRVEASSSVFETSGIWQIVPSMGLDKLLQPAEAETATRRALAWHGRENLYAVTNFMQWHDKGPAHGPKNLADWKKFWGQTETDAREGPLRYHGGNLTSRLTGQVADKITMPLGKFTLGDFRLRPDSAGYRAGKDGKDLGADVDLVGPGLAYERWKKTPEYRQWRKDTGQEKK